jgi:hypothetical protein
MAGESKLLQSLRFCKGITKNSMFSVIIPSYEDINNIIDEIIYLKRINCEQENEDSDDMEIDDIKYMKKIYNETINFIKGMKFQDTDKETIGLMLYYGYIQDQDGSGKKVFHTFPMPKNCLKTEMITSQRFCLGYLNKNPWFLEEFPEGLK